MSCLKITMVIQLYDWPQGCCSTPPPRLSPIPSCSSHVHHPPYLPFEALRTSCWGRRASLVFLGHVVATWIWPFCPACLWVGTKWWLSDKPLCFAALTRSPVLQKLLKAVECFCRANETSLRQQSSLSLCHVVVTQKWVACFGWNIMAVASGPPPCSPGTKWSILLP